MVLEKTLESPLNCKKIKLISPKGNQSWIFTGKTDTETEAPNTLVTWCEEPTHWKRPWCWEMLKTGGQGDDRGWDGSWMTSLSQWAWIEQSPGDGEEQGSLVCCSPWGFRVGHDWATEQQAVSLRSLSLRSLSDLELKFHKAGRYEGRWAWSGDIKSERKPARMSWNPWGWTETHQFLLSLTLVVVLAL